MSRNPDYCPHNILDQDEQGLWCVDCGIEIEEEDDE